MGGCNSDDRADTPCKIERWIVIVRRRVRLLVRNDAGDEQIVNRSLRNSICHGAEQRKSNRRRKRACTLQAENTFW